MFKLSQRSELKLEGVHEDLVKVVRGAIKITEVDFRVIEGLRSPERQQMLFHAGATKTLNSRHLTGHAVDLVAVDQGEIRWDWPLYEKIAEAMLQSGAELGVSVVWGGSWKTFKDGPHFELNRQFYP